MDSSAVALEAENLDVGSAFSVSLSVLSCDKAMEIDLHDSRS